MTPLVQKLEKELGEPVTLKVPKDFAAFWEGVTKGEFDLIHYNQYHYIVSHKEFGHRVLVVNREDGKNTIAGALVVRADSGINTVSDIKGKTILFGGGPKAMGSYIAPTAILKKAGLQEGTDYTAKFANNPPNAVLAAYNKAVDVAGAGDSVLLLPVVTNSVDVKQLKVLATSEEFIQLPWAVHPRVPTDKADKIKQIMSSLDQSTEGKGILKAASVEAFVAADDASFNKVREIVEFANGEKF
jgi:phosphonate transport system substrate-binding protein